MRGKFNIFGRQHIHDYVRTLAEWRKKANPEHCIGDEYDQLLIAGIKAKYNQDVPLELPKPPKPAPTENEGEPPALVVPTHG